MRRGSVRKVSFFAVSSLNKCCFAVQLTKSGTITLPNNGFGRCVTRNCRARRSAISLPAGGNTEANGAGELLSKLLHFNSIRRRRTPILRVVEPAPNETCPTPTVQTPSTLIICAVEFLHTFCIQPWEARSMHTRGVAQGSESAGWPLTTAYCLLRYKELSEKNTTCRAHGQSAATHVEFKAFLQGGTNRSNCGGARIRTHDVFEHPAWVKQPSAATLSTLQGW